MNINAMIDTPPPKNEKTIPRPRAFPACPFSAIGWPSKVVAIDAAVPGIFIKIADIRPPENPPIYTPISNASPSDITILKVIGKNNAIAIVVERPGIAPKIRPTMTPPSINATLGRLSIDKASKKYSPIVTLHQNQIGKTGMPILNP